MKMKSQQPEKTRMTGKKSLGINAEKQLRQALEQYADDHNIARAPAGRQILSEKLMEKGYLE